MKKLLIFLLAMSMMLSAFMFGCGPKNDEPSNDVENNEETTNNEENASNDEEEAENEEEEENGEEEVKRPTEPKGQLIIGDTTAISADLSGAWQNNATTALIRNIMSGYSTATYTDEGEVILDKTVVEKMDVKENEDGSKTFTYTIIPGKKFADGEEITAKNYVASVMIWGSKVMGNGFAGAKNTGGMDYVGYDAYSSGESKEFAGLHLIDDKTFSVTVAADRLPYFYELSMASVGPDSLKFWFGKDYEIKDDGNGCYFVEDVTTKEIADKITAARESANLPTSGPYKMEKYDEAQKQATLVINENYEGNYKGQKPLISKIIFKKITSQTALDDLSTGGVDIIRGMSTGGEINKGLDLVQKGGFNFAEYPRAGYGKIQFSCDFGPTQYKEVRQAIAYLLDRNDFTKQFTGGFGVVANGPWGDAQWFWQESQADLASKLNTYPYDPAKAVELLESVGFNLNESGAEYKKGDGIRYKKMDDGTMLPCIIKWASTDNNEVSDLLVVKLAENPDLIDAGVKIERDSMSFDELLNWVYRDSSVDAKYGEPTYGMFNLGTGFTPIYDQKETYTTDEKLLDMGWNSNKLINKEFEQVCIDMVRRDSTDREGFLEGFKKYAVMWNDLLPDLPLYSNLYHDFYNAKLKNYNPTAIRQLDLTLLDAWIEE